MYARGLNDIPEPFRRFNGDFSGTGGSLSREDDGEVLSAFAEKALPRRNKAIDNLLLMLILILTLD